MKQALDEEQTTVETGSRAGPPVRNRCKRTGPPARAPCKLGVLFVHGIGEQQEGDTLIAFGEPLIAWLRQWVEGHGQFAFAEPLRQKQRERLERDNLRPDGIEVTTTALLPSRRDSLDPPHSYVQLRFKPESEREQRKQCWLFAECWWGEQVKAPPVFALLAWMFSRGPWIAAAHCAERAWRFTHPQQSGAVGTRTARVLRRFDATRWRYLIWPLAAVEFLVLAAVLQMLLLIAALLALIPLPFVRRYVAVVLQRTTSILGDSYGLVANDAQRGAILTRFRGAVEWLDARCEKVVIVAHSQGAAVVHAALSAEVIRPPPLLVTFGAGLVKLAQLRQCELSRSVRLLVAGWILPALLAAVATHVWAAGGDVDIAELKILPWILYGAAALCVIGALTAWSETRSQLAPALKHRPQRWIDLYASSDPVPQGPLDEYLPGCGVESERIINRRSILSDHNTYWKNKPEFVSRVAAELDKEAQLLGIPDLAASADFARVRRHHQDAILVLSWAWWGFVLPLGVWAVLRFRDVANAGAAFLRELRSGPLAFVADYITGAGAIVGWLIERFVGSAPAMLPDLGHASLMIIGVLVLAYLWWKAVVVVFTKWNSALLADFLGYEKESIWGRYGTLLVWPFMDLFAFLPIALAASVLVDMDPVLVMMRALAIVVAAVLASVLLYSAYLSVPKDLSALRRVLKAPWLALLEAVSPGSDEPGAERRGAAAWQGLRTLATTTLMIALGISIAADELFDAPEFFVDAAISAVLLLIAVLLLARLFLLLRQRGYGRAAASAIVVFPALAAPALGVWIDASRVSRVIIACVIAVSCTMLVYAALDRWLPVRVRGQSSMPLTSSATLRG